MESVRDHYAKQAKKWGDSKLSTMEDANIRDKEVEKILAALRGLKDRLKNPAVLEVGCGNGYTAEQIIKELGLPLTCIDFSEELLALARRRRLANVSFSQGDVRYLEFKDDAFDMVFTERCLINLDSWEKQKKALAEVRRVLKPGALFLMIEAFTDGWGNLNKAREDVGLASIPQPFHNVFFDKQKFLRFINGKFQRTSEGEEDPQESEHFLSTYYFGSRVLYPALINGKKELVFNNKFVEFFRHLPSYGQYGSVQSFFLRKV